MSRRPSWQINWEKLHNITARQALIAHLASAATLQKVAFEFGTGLREVRSFCRKEGLPLPPSVIELSEEERERRAERARKNLGNRTIVSGKPLTVMGVTKSRHQWYKFLGGPLNSYYADESVVIEQIKARIAELKDDEGKVKPKVRKPRAPRISFAAQRRALKASLPYAKAAVSDMSEEALRQRLRSILTSIAGAKGALENDREESESEAGPETDS